MGTFAQKSKAARQTASARPASFFPARSGQERNSDPILQRKLSGTQLQRACACGSPAAAGADRAGCANEEGLVRNDGAGAGESADAPPIVHQALGSPGRSLDDTTRAFFEPRFRRDFSQVRVHTDATAAESAGAVNARAYTVGRDVVFATGQYAPDSASGKSLLAHELTHVVQQGGGGEGSEGQHGHGMSAVQRAPTFKDCRTQEKGKEDAKEKILAKAIKDAAPLAQVALNKLTTGILAADVEAYDAFNANFGDPTDDRIKAVVKVYESIKKSLDSKDIVCLPKCEKSKKDPKADTCALAAPGKVISICPEFFRRPCSDLQDFVILHESAHNAGAGGNQDKDPKNTPAKKKQYPPKSGEDNAYSYQYFVDDIQKGTFKRSGVGPSVKEVEVKPTK